MNAFDKKANDNIDLLNMNPVLAVVDFTSQITWSFVMELKQFQGYTRILKKRSASPSCYRT